MRGSERYIGDVLDGKYRLERLLGQGGMGAVYLAIHLGTERPVALKLIAPELMRNDEFVERFKREARAAGRLRHPNVVDVTDFGFAQLGDERVAYLVMEYLDGCTLGDVLAEEASLPVDWVVDILEQICSAVDEAHHQGILHRDLKPDNIWLEPTRLGGYRVKVLDFGIAKLAESGPVTLGPSDRVVDPAEMVPTQLDLEASTLTDHARASAAGATSRATAQRESSPEAGTLLFSANAAGAEQQQTRILPKPAVELPHEDPGVTEAAPGAAIPEGEGAPTLLMQEHGTVQPGHGNLSTNPVADVTRVGTILGTPLYMSPEQCRGARLDQRSDIYSIGVIAYQMLTGQTPFAGDTTAVMRSHVEQEPPPIREKNKKVKKRLAWLVMSALSKDPQGRPPSAAGFASALRGNSEGIGALLRHGFALYSEYFPKFVKVSFLAHLPIIAVMILFIVYDAMDKQNTFSKPVNFILASSLGLLQIMVSFLANSVITALTVLIVTQIHVAPMRPVSLRDAYAVFKSRWKPFLRTSIRVSLTIMLGFILLLIPGLIMMIRYALYAPVVLMEGLEKKAALKRANELSRRSRRTVIALLLINFLLPMLLGAVASLFTLERRGGNLHVGSTLPSRIAQLFNIFMVPLISITTALLYLKMRQMGGETFKETLEQFESVQAPRTKWQQLMRKRLTMHTGERRDVPTQKPSPPTI